MKKILISLAVVLTASVIFWSCQKELSEETGATPTNPGGSLNTYSWQFTGNSTAYSGCIDTAYYTSYNGASVLRIEGSDTKGDYFYILITAPGGKAAKGTYSAAQGQSMMAVIIGSASYTLNPNAVDFKAEITDITDTTVTASFSGKLTDANTATNLEITAGKLKALIGRKNPCTGNTGGGGTTAAAFTLTQGTNNSCGGAVVAGTYQTNNSATSSEKVTLSVNVTTAGSYSIQTSTVSGLSFAGSGTFSNTGVQTVVLQASGTPTATGAITIPVTAGSSNCSFQVNVTAGTAQPYIFSFLDSNTNKTVYGVDTAIIYTASNNDKYLIIIGEVPSQDTLIEMDINLPTGVIETKTYTSPANSIYFSALDTSANPKYYFETEPTLANTQFTLTITSHDPNTKTVIGTFRAVARKDEQDGTYHTLKNGTFKARYK